MEIDFELWYNTYDPIFTDISKKSLLPDKWINYQQIDHDKYQDLIIKPINQYVQALYQPPELVSAEGNTVRLRQKNHAGFFLLDSTEGFINVDRPHMRQYYQTKLSYPADDQCFDPVFLFYTPWFIDYDVTAVIEGTTEKSPFMVYPVNVKYSKVPRNTRYVEPKFVPFRFKKMGPHMVKESFGKIPAGSEMFDIVIVGDDILIEKIGRFYEKN